MTTLHGFEARTIVDTSEREPAYLITTGEGRYLRLSASAFHLLRMVDAGTPMDEIARAFCREGGLVSAEQVREAHGRLMEKVRELDRTVDVSAFGLRYARGVVPAALVRRVSGWLAAAFAPPAALLLVGFVVAAVLTFVRDDRGADLVGIVLPHLWSGYALLFLSLIVHELGHTAACARYGARPADIGVGVYFIYPALYSDVTDAWRLTRWQRVLVDCGGVYFQAVCGALYVVAYHLTGWAPLRAACVMIAANCLFSLNPLFKFDGYWVVSDALGVTNLQADARNVAGTLWARLRGRAAPELRWSRALASTILVAGAVAAGFWALFMVRVLPGLAARVMAYPELLADFVRGLGRAPGGPTAGAVFNFVLASYFVVIGLRMVVGLLRRGVISARAAAPRLAAAIRTRRQMREDAA